MCQQPVVFPGSVFFCIEDPVIPWFIYSTVKPLLVFNLNGNQAALVIGQCASLNLFLYLLVLDNFSGKFEHCLIQHGSEGGREMFETSPIFWVRWERAMMDISFLGSMGKSDNKMYVLFRRSTKVSKQESVDISCSVPFCGLLHFLNALSTKQLLVFYSFFCRFWNPKHWSLNRI